MKNITKKQTALVKKWLTSAHLAAANFNGSRKTDEIGLIEPLALFEAFSQTQNTEDKPRNEIEQAISKMAFPNATGNMPQTIDDFLTEAGKFYDQLKDKKRAQTTSNIKPIVEQAGGVFKQSNKVFIKTGEGHLAKPSTENPTAYEIKTEPRLAILLDHLRNEGVNGEKYYIDDLVINEGSVDPKTMRKLPYHIIQIPSINMEIALCEQVGQTTFVKKGTVGGEFWENMNKNELDARPDVLLVDRHSDKQWWEEVSDFLAEKSEATPKRVNVKKWGQKAPNLDIDLVKKSLLAHRLATGDWLKSTMSIEGGKPGSYILEHGAYKGQIKTCTLKIALIRGRRNLPKEFSIPKLNEIIALENRLNFHRRVKNGSINKILAKQTIAADFLMTGNMIHEKTKDERGKIGAYHFTTGHYEGMKVSTMSTLLRKIGTSISELKNEIKKELSNPEKEIERIKNTFLAEYKNEGILLTGSKQENKNSTKGSYIIRNGYHAGMTEKQFQYLMCTFNTCPREIKESLATEGKLNYDNKKNKKDLTLNDIKESFLALYHETGTLSAKTRKNYPTLKHGACKGIKTKSLRRCLTEGGRGIPKGETTLRKLIDEVTADIKEAEANGTLDQLSYLSDEEGEDADIENRSELGEAPAP